MLQVPVLLGGHEFNVVFAVLKRCQVRMWCRRLSSNHALQVSVSPRRREFTVVDVVIAMLDGVVYVALICLAYWHRGAHVEAWKMMMEPLEYLLLEDQGGVDVVEEKKFEELGGLNRGRGGRVS